MWRLFWSEQEPSCSGKNELWVVFGTAMDAANKAVIGLSSDTCRRIYANVGNAPLVELLDDSCNTLLDVGCGAGDNAVLVKARNPRCQVFGVTRSESEAERARHHMAECLVFDIEGDFPAEILVRQFDAILFSHVLEHLRDPAAVLSRFVTYLRSGGVVLIAVPNVVNWRQRTQLLLGRFEYEAAGVMDDTHLRFFTFRTADKYLLVRSPELEVMRKEVTGSVPLWWLRRYVFPRAWSDAVDVWGCRHWPNLFGGQILIKAKKK